MLKVVLLTCGEVPSHVSDPCFGACVVGDPYPWQVFTVRQSEVAPLPEGYSSLLLFNYVGTFRVTKMLLQCNTIFITKGKPCRIPRFYDTVRKCIVVKHGLQHNIVRQFFLILHMVWKREAEPKQFHVKN